MADSHEDRLARATGKKATLPPVPPPAKPSPNPGIKGGSLPLPQGRVVTVPTASSLTKAEREALQAVGYQEGDPIPEGMADIFHEVQAELAAQEEQVVLPVSPDTPKLQVPIIEKEKLSPEMQSHVQARMQEMLATERASREAAEQASKRNVAPSVQAAITKAEEQMVVEDDLSGVKEPATTAEAPKTGSDTGASGQPLTHCPHCAWDLSQVAIPEPAQVEKMAFMQSVLGDKPYIKEYVLFGGLAKVSFRTLTIAEIDSIYRRVYSDRELGKISNDLDFWEKTNRFRLILQLHSYHTQGQRKDFPEGLSTDTNKYAHTFWADTLAPKPPDGTAADDLLPLIETHILQDVLRSEAIFRTVHNQCRQFNRLVAKMEAMVDNSDFWKPTA